MDLGLTTIGRAEKVNLPSLKLQKIPAKIDTGADASSLWCSKAELKDGVLSCIFFSPKSPYYTGKACEFHKGEFTITRIANSFGHREMRYKVKIPVKIRGKLIKATFTLSDRSQKLYPILIGRSSLRGKFVVDVRKGSPLRGEERARIKRLRNELRRMGGGLKNENRNLI
jgi:hypothetical protein